MPSDLMIGLVDGIIIALGIQSKAVYAQILTNWMIYPFLNWLFCYHYDLGLLGIWIAKSSLNYCKLITFMWIIET
jgi:Na+-driven multidrug efflux pump